MSTDPATDMFPRRDGDWEALGRVESWAGEIRVNVIRVLAIALFYGRHLIELMLSARDSDVRGVFHARVTAVVVAWAAMAGVVHILLRRRRYPPEMKFVTSVLDVLMITLLCAIAGGPKTPLVLLFFLAIAAAPLRLSLPLIYATTGAAVLGYLVLLAYYAWYLIGFKTYYASPELQIGRGQEAIVILCLLVCGMLAGQVVRQARRMVERYPLAIAAGEREE